MSSIQCLKRKKIEVEFYVFTHTNTNTCEFWLLLFDTGCWTVKENSILLLIFLEVASLLRLSCSQPLLTRVTSLPLRGVSYLLLHALFVLLTKLSLKQASRSPFSSQLYREWDSRTLPTPSYLCRLRSNLLMPKADSQVFLSSSWLREGLK